MAAFDQQLKTGRIGEGIIANWFIGRGYCVLPAYEIEIPTGKGPRLFTSEGGIISPDMLVFNQNKIFWIEAKTKSAFTFYRKTWTFQTGIDKRHWNEYLKIQDFINWPIWLLFFHKKGNLAKDTPEGMVSPYGLFGNDINKLRHTIDHPSDNWGNSGMVYWNKDDLILIDSNLE